MRDVLACHVLCTMCHVRCALCLVPCTTCQRALCHVPCALCHAPCANVPCAMCCAPCAMCRVPCTMCHVPHAVCCVPRAMCLVPCATCHMPRALCLVPCAMCHAPMPCANAQRRGDPSSHQAAPRQGTSITSRCRRHPQCQPALPSTQTGPGLREASPPAPQEAKETGLGALKERGCQIWGALKY